MVIEFGEAVHVCFDLHRQHAYLFGINLQLIWLAIEREALDNVRHLSGLCSYESEFNVGIKVAAQVFEGKFEFLNAIHLFDSEGHDILPSGLVYQLPHALDLWIFQVAQQQNLHDVTNLLLLEHNPVIFANMLLNWSLTSSLELNVDEGHDHGTKLVLRRFNDHDKLLTLTRL